MFKTRIKEMGLTRALLEYSLLILLFYIWQFIVIPQIDILTLPLNLDLYLKQNLSFLPSETFNQQPSVIIGFILTCLGLIVGWSFKLSVYIIKFLSDISSPKLLGIIIAFMIGLIILKKNEARIPN